MGYTVKKAENEKMILRIVQDEDISSPREYDNLGTMMCWHNRYILGDKNNFSEPKDFLLSLAEDYQEGETYKRIAKIKTDKEFEGLKVVLKSDEYIIESNGNNNPFWKYTYDTFDEAQNDLTDTIKEWEEEMLNELNDEELMEIIEQHVVILPLFLYDHSGVTMRTSSFNDRWDSGQVGWIYAEKTYLLEETGYNHQQLFNEGKAEELLIGEVKTYDQFLTGDVYGFILEEKDEEGEVLDVIDSCWGFYGLEHLKAELLEQIGNENLDLIENLEYVQ
jgi:hypothetical protein